MSFYLGWDFARLAEEIAERPYVLGFAAWLVLVLLAATSTRQVMWWLGRNWKRFTQVYFALAFAGVHYLLMIRSEWAWPVSYAAIALVLTLRLPRTRSKPTSAEAITRAFG